MDIQKFDFHKRAEEKRLKRNLDIADMVSGRFTRTELQERNSMFSCIDWSEVEIFEATGYNWKPKFS